MRSKGQIGLATVILLCATRLLAQDTALPSGSININLAKDSPVTLVGMISNESRATARGAALVLDLHMALTFRNAGASRIHGVMLRVVSQEVTLGGKGSVTIPSMNIAPGEAFPVRIDMQLVRPTQMAGGPLVEVDLDGVLYQDLSFYGPDRMHSRRYLTACEVEAQRDREYLKRVLAQGGKEGLRQEIFQIGGRQQAAPLSVKVVPHGPAVTSAALPPEHPEKFAFVEFPDSPVEAVQGWAQVAGNEARAPNIEVRNRSAKPVKYVELGWVLTDQAGRQSVAASLPSAERDLYLAPDKTFTVRQDTTLRLFSNSGQPVNVQKMTGFVNQVEFADGKVWVPNRKSLQDPALLKAVAPSAEEQRLANLYNRGGIEVLVEELKKF
ncbi:conserved exported hypothetical protein [Candidatus Sulfopaludibacter sp. SbA6]|nr:conserved exported hypothetical protein [Candidatus Sulfopaludibacter sp. SbA6]